MDNAAGIDLLFNLLRNEPLQKDFIFPLKKYKFENIDLYGPNKPESLLTVLFGEHDDLPAYENRRTHLKRVIFKD